MLYRSEQYFETLVIGTGCAGYNAADWLYDLGHRNIAILTEGINMGTSRNTGSDKQTYYKLSLASGESDNVKEMAETLFSGGGMHGDTALVEAACSIKAFMKLVLLGVPFPTNRFGEYIGYKTDHDPRQRATSCGPLTSKHMTEALENAVNQKGIPILNNMQAIKLITKDNTISCVVALDTGSGEYHVFACDNVILATGGPAGIYQHSVYPESQTGGTGLALEAGARAQNLSEWQYGIASTKFRWNVSGTYQQVLPRYISIGADSKEREFLPMNYQSPLEAMHMVFLKGYQWPFDVRKVDGSSRIDMLVHQEIQKGNRVFMDFRANPVGLEGHFEELPEEAYKYLKNSGALYGTPIERLLKMNPLAVKLYLDHGIDLYNEPLEVAVCAQHCNGGIAVDANWETNIKGLYAVGEAAGTLGIYRPGGSALNSTQVGAMRAAEHIAQLETRSMRSVCIDIPEIKLSEISNIAEKLHYTRQAMSNHAAFFRTYSDMEALLNKLIAMRDSRDVTISSSHELPAFYKYKDTLLTQIATLSAMLLSAKTFGSRGSGLVKGVDIVNNVQNAVVITENHASNIEPVRPIPDGGGWFETVWNEYNQLKAKAAH